MRDREGEWRSVVLGSFVEPTEKELRAERLWAEYYRATDAYDDSICTGPSGPDGTKMPATPLERELINRFARERMTELRHAACDIDEVTLRAAKKQVLSGRR